MMSPIFFLRSTLEILKAENVFVHFTTQLMIHHFPIWHIRLSILLIQAVCGNSLAQLGVSVAQLQNIRARRSEVRLLATQHFFFFPCLWPDRKNFSHVSIQNKWAIRNYHIFFLWFRGYRILQQLIGSCISLFSDVNINFLGTLSGCLNRAQENGGAHRSIENLRWGINKFNAVQNTFNFQCHVTGVWQVSRRSYWLLSVGSLFSGYLIVTHFALEFTFHAPSSCTSAQASKQPRR